MPQRIVFLPLSRRKRRAMLALGTFADPFGKAVVR